MKRIWYYLKIWLLMGRNAFISGFHSKGSFFLFLLGKILKFGLFIVFMIFLIKGAGGLAGYSLNQAIFFFLTFNFIDIVSQFFFREVYRFRPMIVSGDFDLVLVKPLNSLFRVLFGGMDVIDFITVPPLLWALYFVGSSFGPSLWQTVVYILLLFNGLAIAAAFHIAVLAFGILTMEIDHVVWVYRDLLTLGRFPVDIYKQPLRGLITYLLPVGVMISLPAGALMGLVNTQGVIISFAIGVIAIFASFKFWQFALRYYTSASS